MAEKPITITLKNVETIFKRAVMRIKGYVPVNVWELYDDKK